MNLYALGLNHHTAPLGVRERVVFHVERLREAKYDLAARWRVDTDEQAILLQFIDEAFGPWVASKLEAKS